MGQVRVADLPTTDKIDPQSYVIIEKPGQGDGTFKSTVGDLQKAITVTANITRENKVTTIYIKDINGETSDTFVVPTANIRDNGDNTLTITLIDTDGTTEQTLCKGAVILDPYPEEGSKNIVTSGTIFDIMEELRSEFNASFADLKDELSKKLYKITESIDNLANKVTFIESVVKLSYYLPLLNEEVENVTTESFEDILVPVYGSILDMYRDGGIAETPFQVNGKVYTDFEEAFDAALESDGTLSLTSNALVTDFVIPCQANMAIDLNGHTLIVLGPLTGTDKVTGITLCKDSNVIIKDGTINLMHENIDLGLENYANLILEDVEIKGGLNVEYVLENKFGDIHLRDQTKLVASDGQAAFNCLYGSASQYDAGVNVTIDDMSVVVEGRIEFGKADRVSKSKFRDNASITCPKDMELDVTVLTEPCDWTVTDTTKTLRYANS